MTSQKFMPAVPEVWLLSTVKKDDVKIIKMFYDIPAPLDPKISPIVPICTIAIISLPPLVVVAKNYSEHHYQQN